MAAEEVHKLLLATLAADKELKQNKSTAIASQKKGSIKLEKDLTALEERCKKIKQSVTSLSQREVESGKRLIAMKQDHNARFQSYDAVVKREEGVVLAANHILTRVRKIVEMTDETDPSRRMHIPIKFCLRGFKNRKKNEECHDTQPFYTHPSGYKMCLVVYFNGNQEGKGTHLSVYLKVLPGEFDEILAWPFCGEVTIRLINQRKNKFHHQQAVALTSDANLHVRKKPDVGANPANQSSWGFAKFIPFSELSAKGMFADKEYLKDDSIILQVYNVEIYNLRH
jgi:TNF receptor-associated factor 4